MSKLVGTWEFESSENWEEFLKEMNVGMILRKTAAGLKPTVFITNNGNQWGVKTVTTFKTMETNATEDVEFEETTPDDKKSKCIIHRDGPNKITQEQRDAKTGQLRATIEREADDNRLVITYKAGSVVCKRTFRRKA